jgi:tetratricopeptide (TPR) repeat protein
LERDPEDGLTQAIYGEALAAQRDDPGAMEHFQQATTHAPHQSAPWLSLARAYQRAGQASKATETLSAASHAVPNDPAIHLALAEAYLAEDAMTQAQTHLRKAYELACERPGLRKNRKQESTGGKQVPAEADAHPSSSPCFMERFSQLGHPDKARQVLENTFLISLLTPDWRMLSPACCSNRRSPGRLESAGGCRQSCSQTHIPA